MSDFRRFVRYAQVGDRIHFVFQGFHVATVTAIDNSEPTPRYTYMDDYNERGVISHDNVRHIYRGNYSRPRHQMCLRDLIDIMDTVDYVFVDGRRILHPSITFCKSDIRANDARIVYEDNYRQRHCQLNTVCTVELVQTE